MPKRTQRETEIDSLDIAQVKPAPILARLGRLLFCLAIAVVAVYCLIFLQDMRSSSAQRETKELFSGQNSPGPLLPLMEALHGNWQFAGVPWSVLSKELPSGEADRMLNGPVSLRDLPAPPPADDDADGQQTKSSDEVAELVHAVVDMLGASQSIESDLCVYRLASNDFTAIAFAPRAQPKRIQLVRLLQNLGQEKVNFVELRRDNSDRAANSSDEKVTLLPHHPDNLRLGIRLNEQGFLAAELIQLRTDFDRVQSMWRHAGWVLTIQPSILPGSNDLGFANDTTTVLATRDDDVVLAIVTRASPQLPPTLFLVRAPR